jgi:flavin-dependent dehydrogenase
LRIIHGVIPGEELSTDRLVFLNPDLFALHELLASLKRKLDLTSMYGLRFLGSAIDQSSQHVSKSITAYVGGFKQLQDAAMKLATTADVTLSKNQTLDIHGLDETGVDVTVGTMRCKPKLLLVAGELPAKHRRILGIPTAWDADVLHRYSYVKLKGTKWINESSRPLVPMSLDVKSTLGWGWLLPGPDHTQIAVEQPLESAARTPPRQLLSAWLESLYAHGVLTTPPASIDVSTAVSVDLPFAGALSQDTVANRTVLFGPAGGFYTACAEDIYPCCWSAIFAVDSARKAVKERFLQDALQHHRTQWGSTLGDYLRGPQQNLRFLLPLVFRNQAMTDRLADAILSGKSVVR